MTYRPNITVNNVIASQIPTIAFLNIPIWTSTTRPVLTANQVAMGYNVSIPQMEYSVGASGDWNPVGSWGA